MLRNTKFNSINTDQAGFTLIELLVTIGIIGMMASIVLVSVNGARKKARDSRRMADLRQMNTAIQLYIQDIGHAPYVGALNCHGTSTGNTCTQVTSAGDDATYWGYLQTELQSYLRRLPSDPCGAPCNQGDRWATYIYHPPRAVAWLCSCTASNINEQYHILAVVMETASTNYNLTYRGFPTFGFKNSSLINIGSN